MRRPDMAARADLDAILTTIREVETSLERRTMRAVGANLMIWGLASASIFAFYELVERNPAPYQDALGAALSWVWLAPIAVGYVASAVVGARIGRFGADRAARRAYAKGFVPGLLVSAVAAALLLTGRGEMVPGALLVALGATFVAFGDRATRMGRACLALAAVLVLSGAAVLTFQPSWASLAAAVAMGGGLVALGTWTYFDAR